MCVLVRCACVAWMLSLWLVVNVLVGLPSRVCITVGGISVNSRSLEDTKALKTTSNRFIPLT